MISEPAQKCENYAAILKQNYTLKQFISLKMAFSCCFGSVQNLDFLQKMFYRYGAALNLIRQHLCGTKGPMSMSMQSLLYPENTNRWGRFTVQLVSSLTRQEKKLTAKISEAED